MADVTAVNSQITDSITQSNVEVLGSAPGQAMAALFTALSHSLSLAAANAVTQQQQANLLLQAITSRAVTRILGPAEEAKPRHG